MNNAGGASGTGMSGTSASARESHALATAQGTLPDGSAAARPAGAAAALRALLRRAT
jgi:hypothetical protein